MIEVDEIIGVLKHDIENKEILIKDIDDELEQMEKRKIELMDKKSSASFYIDKLSKSVDIIERAKKSDKPFEEIHPKLVLPKVFEEQSFNVLAFGHTMMSVPRCRCRLI